MPDGGAAFPTVWEHFGWTHSPPSAQGAPDPGIADEAMQVVTLLQRLPHETLRESIGGIAQWYSAWAGVLASIPAATNLWLTLWPIAVKATNETPPTEDQDITAVLNPSASSSVAQIDTLNTPAGKLVEFFLALCPSLSDEPHPFAAEGSPLRSVRDALMRAGGRSGLIVRHWLLEQINYLLPADRAWTEQELIAPLRAETAEALSLWQAIARRTVRNDVMSIIGNTLSERAADPRLDRETRQMLIFSLVLEALYALKDDRPPVVERARIQQTLRSVEDEVRSHAADTVRRFVTDVSKDEAAGAPTAEQLLRTAAAPFLKEIWPLERSLVTPGVSRAFASLPAATGEAFAEAVTTINRYLVPFDCWSMNEYGFYENDEDGHPKLSLIDSPLKAEALLRLLDHTIGTSVNAVVPIDLSDALQRIQDVSAQLTHRPEFQRLATVARRS